MDASTDTVGQNVYGDGVTPTDSTMVPRTTIMCHVKEKIIMRAVMDGHVLGHVQCEHTNNRHNGGSN